MNDWDILRQSALEQARMIRSGFLSSEELTKIYLRRIEELDGDIHAFVDVYSEEALRCARRADRAKPPEGALFYGVPIAVKDLNAVRGTFLRMGSRAFARFLTPADDFIVARLRRAGFIIVGKTATSELGALPVTEPDTHPPTRNPWDLGVTPGGSSGGAGAALAADLVPIAQGSDGGGSVRIPAAFCGVVGMKPSRGVVPNPFGMEQPDIVWTCGSMAHSVEDAAALLDVMSASPAAVPGEPLSARSASAISPSGAATGSACFSSFLDRCRDPLRPLRVRVATEVHIVPTEDDIRAAVERVAAMLVDLGHLVEFQPVLSGVTVDEFLPIWQELIAGIPVSDWSLTQPLTRWLAEMGRKLKRHEVAASIGSLSERIRALFGDADILLTPTVAVGPRPIGWLTGLAPLETFRRAAELGAFTGAFNVSGQPAISIPAAVDRNGHPIGVQLVGRCGDDATVLALARALEQPLGFHGLMARKRAA